MVSAGAKQMPAPSEVTISAGEHDAERLRRRAIATIAHGADRQPDDERRAAADPVGVAAGDRRQHRLQRRPGDEAAGDQRVAAAERVDPQRHQHLDRAEHQRGDGDEGGRGQDRAAERSSRRPRAGPARSGARPRAGGRRRRRAPAATPSTDAEDELGADCGRERPERRAEQGAGDGASPARCRSPSRAAPAGAVGDQPGQRAGPDQRAGDALGEAGGVEQGDLVGEAEGEAGEAEQQQAADDACGAARSGLATQPGRQRGEQGAGRVGGGEDPGLAPC